MPVPPPRAARISQHARRRAHRAVAAVLSGRKPGRPGVSRSVPGSQGGDNGARDARRASRAEASKKRKRSRNTLVIRTGDAPQLARDDDSASQPARDGSGSALARQRCVVVEVFAGPKSKVAEEAAKLGCAAVRVVEGVDGVPTDAPKLVPGEAVTWHVQLLDSTHAARLFALLKDLGRRTCSRAADHLERVLLLTAPPCTAWCSWNELNISTGVLSLAAWRRGRRTGWAGLRVARHSHAALMATADPRRVIQIHEQPAGALAPSSENFTRHASTEWPWGISHPATVSTLCHGCALGLRVEEQVLQKGWRFQCLGTHLVPRLLAAYTCTRDHTHSRARGRLAKLSESYPRELAVFLTADFLDEPLP